MHTKTWLQFWSTWTILVSFSTYRISVIADSDQSLQSIQKLSYVVIAPKRIHPSSNYTIFVGGSGSTPQQNTLLSISVAIECHIRNTSPEALYSAILGPFPVATNAAEIASFSTPATLDDANVKSCSLVISDAENQHELERRDISLAARSDSSESKIFLQLNKPAYKPLDTVRLRLIVLNEHSLPELNKENIKVTFYDPMGVAINKWPNQDNGNITMDQNGLIRLDLPLADELVYGSWKIEVTANDKSLTKEFLIQKYILPKFDIKFQVNPKPYITQATTSLSVDVQVMYTYQKPLSGHLRLTLVNPVSPNRNSTKAMDLTQGKASFSFDLLADLGQNSITAGSEFVLYVNVTEARTRRLQTAVHRIPVFEKDPFKITWLNPVTFYKPLPTFVQFAVSDYENMPVIDPNAGALTLESKLVSQSTEYQKTSLPIPLNGIVTFELTLPQNDETFEYIKVSYKDIDLNITPPRPIKIGNGSGAIYLNLGLEATPEELERGSNVLVKIESSEPISDQRFNYVLWSGREIIGVRTDVPLENGRIEVHLPEDKPYAQLKLIVYTITNSVTVNRKGMLCGAIRLPTNNYLEMSHVASTLTVEPGTNQTISFKTHPGSTIAMRGVDQSLLLMSRDKMFNDIHPSDVPFNPFYHTYRAEDQSTFSQNSCFDFENSGLYFLSNSDEIQGRKISKRQASNAANSLNDDSRSSDDSNYDATIRTRNHFPETWLWNELLATDFTTVFSEDVPVVPDTLTSWYVTALSLNRHSGLAVSQAPLILTVFRPFFITLNLPYSVIQGETFAIQVLVHNYLNHSIQAQITLFNDAQDIRFSERSELEKTNVTRVVTVEKATVGNVSFVIMPLTSGEVPLRIHAVSDVAGDAITRYLRVEVPGVKVWDSLSSKIYDSNSSSHFENFTIQRKRAKRDTQHKLTLAGTPLDSQSISKGHTRVSGLVQQPDGCGEQSMSKFVPNVLALDWLRVNHKEDVDMDIMARGHLRTGYQLQMKFFNHRDGSFQYFPTSARKDSTWLTAYVLRCLTQARQYIFVDDRVLLKGLGYLLRRQNPKTGEFKGTGSPIYGAHLQGMRDSASANYGLTAYVTLAIIEITDAMSKSTQLERSDAIKFNGAKIKGLNFISSESSLMDSDAYNLILVTTTLAAANHASAQLFFEKMERIASTSTDGKMKWWEMNPENVTSALSVEMTAYSLLAYLWMGKATAGNCLPIVRWLLNQKTDGGGFKTTQDTVVAFQALSKFAEITISTSSDDSVSIAVLNQDEILGQLVINSTNRDAAHEFLLPKYLKDGEFTVLLRGKGKAFIQYIEEYYTDKVNTSNFYKITAKLKEDTEADVLNAYKLDFCLKLNNSSYNASGQVVADLKLPTSYAFDGGVDDFFEQGSGNDTIVNIELKESNTRVNIYYAHLNFPEQCLTLPVKLDSKTVGYKGRVKVTDYYNPQNTDNTFIYPDRIFTECEICLDSGGCDIISRCM